MKSLFKPIVFVVLICSSYLAVAEIIVYPFTNPEREERFNQLIFELRCPKCQNNNLADSNAPLAVDLKDIVYEKINNGETDEEIIFYLKQRYGDFISYRPPVKPSTWLIWYGPFIFLLLGGLLIYRYVSNQKKNQNRPIVATTSTSSEELLEQWSKESTSEYGDKP